MPGVIVHLVKNDGECHAALLLEAPDPTHATLLALDTNTNWRNIAHSDSLPGNNSMATWHSMDRCRVEWPLLPDGQYVSTR